jgi:hypothetical protein
MKFSRFVGNSQKSFSKATFKRTWKFPINIESFLKRNNSITPESTKSEKHAKLFMIELIMHVSRDSRFELNKLVLIICEKFWENRSFVFTVYWLLVLVIGWVFDRIWKNNSKSHEHFMLQFSNSEKNTFRIRLHSLKSKLLLI